MIHLESCDRLWPEERQWHHGHAILSAIGSRPGGEDHQVHDIVRQLIPQPQEMTNIRVIDRRRELHLDTHDLSVRPFDNQIHFAIPVPGAEVGPYATFSRFSRFLLAGFLRY